MSCFNSLKLYAKNLLNGVHIYKYSNPAQTHMERRVQANMNFHFLAVQFLDLRKSYFEIYRILFL